MKAVRALLVSLLVLSVACGRSTTTGGGGSPSPSGGGGGGGKELSQVELKLRVLDALGAEARIEWCDPDQFPVARGTELENARAHLDAMRKDRATFRAILRHLGIANGDDLTDQEVVEVYRDYKLVSANGPLALEASGGAFTFSVVVADAKSGYADKVSGEVTRDGDVSITERIEGGKDGHSFEPNCPICLSRGTRIATPHGPIPVQDVRVGMTVWSTDASGRRIGVRVEAVGRTPVPATHQVVRLRLATGRVVFVSPGHPTPDGRVVGDLSRGDLLDGSRVVGARLVRYRGSFTYDLLPAGPTGTYFANGVLLGSTLAG